MTDMAKKLELGLHGVNLRYALLLAILTAACGPSPMPVAIGNAPAYGTYLGDQRRALYEDESIPLTEPKVEWDINAGSGMRGTLLLLDSTIVTATTNRQLLAYHRRSGRRHWDQRFGNAVTSTVLYENRMVYVGTDESDGGLHALDITRGRERWKQKLGAIHFTPLLANHVIYLGTDAGIVMALSTERGARIWRVGVGAALAETPVDAGAHIIAITNRDSVLALRKTDGGLIARGILPGTPSAPPALSGNTLIVPVQPNFIVGLDANTLVPIWRFTTDAPVLAAPVVSRDGVAYLAARDGSLYAIQEGRGRKLAQLDHTLSGSLTLARDHLVLGSYDGTLLAVSLDGKVLWTHRLNDSIIAPVALGDGAIFVPLLRGAIVKLR
jgi:outer membrane protein assembly factor BamB